MKVSRRSFLKGTAATGAAAAGARYLSGGPLEALASAEESALSTKEDFVPTVCWIGKQDCGIMARRVGGRVIKLEGLEGNPRNLGTLCPKGVGQITALYDPNRVTTPLVRTNKKGVSGEWRTASWDEAMTLVADKVKAAREKDPALVLWQKGRSKSKELYDDALTEALGCSKLGHGAYCSDAGYRAVEYTIGVKGVLHPDFRNTNYVLAWGYNFLNAGGNKLCWITWPRQVLEARERGMKMVVIDPRLRSVGPYADDWLPIKPGTDLALALGFANVLLADGTLDIDYLTAYTNAPYLVGEDGQFLKRKDTPLIWDANSKAAVAVDTAGVTPELEGDYAVDGVPVKTAFTLYKEHLAQYTPDWAAEITGLEAGDISRIARELAANALIGDTAKVGDLTLPHRPVSVMTYHAMQQELGFQATRAILQVFMLMGAVGAVGGVFADFSWKIDDKYAEWDAVEITDPPYGITMSGSKYFPISSANPSIVAEAVLDPAKWEVDPEKIPEVVIVHMANPALWPNAETQRKAYAKFPFVTVISPWVSETADLFADVVLPAATLEKYEGPIKPGDQYVDAISVRTPPMEPLGESKGEIDIYLDLTERVGVLYGEGGYLHYINEHLELPEEYALALEGERPTARDIFDRWSKAQGIAEGISYFETHGVKVKGPADMAAFYGYAVSPPFAGALHRFYGDALARYRATMQEKGADEAFWQDYTAYPTWRPLTKDASPADYDLDLISYKLVENKQNRSSGYLPFIHELTPRQRLDINPRTATERGVSDGQEVVVEAHNAVTGETASVTVNAHFTEAIRPDVVGMPHHFGLWAHPLAKGQGPSPNSLFPSGKGYVANTGDQTYLVKVRVSPA